MTSSLIQREKTSEWLEFISRIGLIRIEDAREVFLSGGYSQITDPGQKALYAAGRGKTLSLEGNLIGSKLTLDEAQLLAETRNAEQGYPTKDEVLAYVHYERAVFFQKYGEVFDGLGLFRSARRLVESKSLESAIDYQISNLQLQNGTVSSIKEVQGWIHFFAQSNMQIMRVLALRQLAKYHRDHIEHKEAGNLLLEALNLGIKFDFPFIVEQVENSYGYTLYKMGKIPEARKLFLRLIQGIGSRYLKSTILENLTLTHYDEKEYDTASEYLSQAIEHSQKYDILSLIPDECLFMGDLYREQLQHPELATHYYDIGSQAALRMAEFGFRLKGDRLQVVKRFENRPKVGYSLPESLGQRARPFAFATGKTWKEINDLFQFYLIGSHLESSSNHAELPDKLGLKPSTYYAIKRRLNQHGYDFGEITPKLSTLLKTSEQLGLKSYVNDLTELTWAQANQRFEAAIIEYLFKQVGYQKTKLAEKLDISYPTVLQKTRSLKRM